MDKGAFGGNRKWRDSQSDTTAGSSLQQVAFRWGPLPPPPNLPPFSRNTGTGGGMWCGPRPDASTPVVPYQLLRNLHCLGSFPSLLSFHLFSTLKQRFQFQILWAGRICTDAWSVSDLTSVLEPIASFEVEPMLASRSNRAPIQDK